MSAPVRYTRDDAVGIVTLDRPDTHNRMTPELLAAFSAAIAAARADAAARCVVITGTGAAFSAGADLTSTLAPPPDDDGTVTPSERSYRVYEPFLGVLDVAVPVIAALNGHAVGGGFGLALACDLRIGAAGAKYGANFVRLGLSPGMAISFFLPRLVGPARAAELLYTGRLVDGAEAERLGILNRAVAAADVLPAALALAREIASAAPIAVRATKRALGRGLALAAREAARAEAAAQSETLGTADAREGIDAQLAKRPPRFTGR